MAVRDSGKQPPDAPDGGWGWVVVAAAFLLNMQNGGLFSIHGVLYESFLHTFPQLTATSAALVISLQAGLCYIAGLSVGPVLAVWTCRRLTALGGALMAVGLAVSAFSTNTTYLYVFFSILTGIGMGFQCLPSSILVQRYFNRNRSLAGGISLSGGPVGVFIFPPVCQLLMDHYGWRGMLLLCAGVILNSLPLALLLRPLRHPDSPADSTISKNKDLDHDNCLAKTKKALSQVLNLSVLGTLGTWVQITTWFLTMAGVSGFYTNITVKCSALHLPRTSIAFLISLSGIMETIGRVLSGVIGNFRCVNRVYFFCWGIFICGFCSILSGFVTNYSLLLVYAAAFGLTIGIFVGLGATIVVDLMGKSLLPHVLGFCFFAGGIGNFIALPLMALSLQRTGNHGTPFFIIGSCHLLASIIEMTYFIRLKFQGVMIPSNENKGKDGPV